MALQPEHITAIIDTREQLPYDLSPLRMRTGTLQIGDYSLAAAPHLVAVERKSIDDFAAGVGRNRERFENQLARLKSVPHRLLVIEASWSQLASGNYRSKVSPASVCGSLMGWMSQGIPCLLADNREAAQLAVARFLFLTARRQWQVAQEMAKMFPE